MAVEIKVPEVGESVTEVEIGQWLIEEGGFADLDEPLVEIESEKATLELPSPAAGTITQVLKQTGEPAEVGEVIGYLEPGAAKAKNGAPAKPEKKPEPAPEPGVSPQPPAPETGSPGEEQPQTPGASATDNWVMPSAQRVMAQKGVDRTQVEPTGPGGRILKEDAERAAPPPQPAQSATQPQRQTQAPAPQPSPSQPAPVQPAAPSAGPPNRESHRVRMTPIRRTIAARLVEAQQNAALLTTFNEVDMAPVKQMRADLQESFEEKHGVKLGFMSFFVGAAVHALQEFPQVNAQVHGEEIVYHNYCDVGIAVGSGKGLVVPVLRNAEAMSFADIEKAVADFGSRAKENKISMDELQGGTFTISNGGVYGSMLSTPIVNPPQSGVLGMHNIIERPVALDGQVVIRPMMYIALTYDHRIVDGREAVTFLKTIKEHIEKPALLFDF